MKIFFLFLQKSSSKQYPIPILILTSIIASIISLPYHSYTIEISEKELKNVPNQSIQFTNYDGPYSKKDSIKSVKSIGTQLANTLKKNPQKIAQYFSKYSVQRIFDPSKPQFSADIFRINPNALVKNIRFLRLIIRSYLQQMYDYSPQQAKALALFITYYNAFYRSQFDYFKTKYIPPVLQILALNPNSIGLSTVYSEWPGKTLIVIPITQQSPQSKQPDQVDPFVISDPNIQNEIRKNPQNFQAREDLIKIKEKNLEQNQPSQQPNPTKTQNPNQKQIQEKQKQIQQEKNLLEQDKLKNQLEKKESQIQQQQSQIQEQESQIQQQQTQIQEQESQIQQQQTQTKEQESQIQQQQTQIQEQESQIQQQQTQTKEQESQIQQQQTQIQEQESQIQEQQTQIQEQESQIQQQESQIQQQQIQAQKKLAKNLFGNSLYYLKVKEYLEGGHYNNEMFIINLQNQTINPNITISNICGRRYDTFADGVVVITHNGNHNAEHSLTLLDRKTLKPLKTSSNHIFWRSFIEIQNQHIYALIVQNNQYYLGKYDKDIRLVAQSSVPVSENTFISFFEKSIYINGQNDEVIILNHENLKQESQITP